MMNMKPAPLVLLLDDDDAIAQLCLRLLQGGELALITAGTIAQARLLAATQAFDLVLCDMGLPDGHGLDFVAHFRSKQPDVPVIAITGAPGPEVQRRAALLGVRSFLVKPFAAGELKEAVKKALRSSQEIQRRDHE